MAIRAAEQNGHGRSDVDDDLSFVERAETGPSRPPRLPQPPKPAKRSRGPQKAKALLVLADAAAVFTAMGTAMWIRRVLPNGFNVDGHMNAWPSLLVTPLWIAALAMYRVYSARSIASRADEAR